MQATAAINKLEAASLPDGSKMYLEISCEGDNLLELPISRANKLEGFLQLLFIANDEEYGLSEAYNEPGEWFSELTITAIYY